MNSVRCIGDRVRLSRHIRKQWIPYVPLPLVPDYIMSRAENTIHTNPGTHTHTQTHIQTLAASQFLLAPSPPTTTIAAVPLFHHPYTALSYSSDPRYPLLPLVMHFFPPSRPYEWQSPFPHPHHHQPSPFFHYCDVLSLGPWFTYAIRCDSKFPSHPAHTVWLPNDSPHGPSLSLDYPQCFDPFFWFPYTSSLPYRFHTLQRSHTGHHQRMGQGEVEGHAKVKSGSVRSWVTRHDTLDWHYQN